VPGAVSITPAIPSTAAGAYAEHPAAVALAPHVECVWSRGASADAGALPRVHRVIPDGCVDIILTLDGRATAAAIGAMTGAAVFRDSPGTCYIGARFRPGVAGVLFGLPAAELTDQSVDLGDVWRDAEPLCEAVAWAPDTPGRVRALAAAVARRLLGAQSAPPRTVVAAAQRITGARGDLSIGVLAEQLGVTRQHLARLFAEHVGLSPKMLARVVRARSVVDRIRRGGGGDWSALALDAGYYDQSHLIGELKDLTGLPPRAWAAGGS